MFNQSIQSASYIVVLRDYLLKDELATKEEVEKELGSESITSTTSSSDDVV